MIGSGSITLTGRLWLVLISALVILIGCTSIPNEEDVRVIPTMAPSLTPLTPTVIPSPEMVTTSVSPSPTTPPIVTNTETQENPVPVATLVSEGEGRIVQQVASPDGQWIATTTYTDFDVQGPIAGTFTLTNRQNNEEMVLEDLVVAEGNRWLDEVPLPLAWRADSQAFYYTYVGVPIDGCFIPSPNPLHQYTLAAGSHQILSTPAGSEYTFSPDGEQVAYFPVLPADAPPALAMYAPATDTLQEIPFPEFDPALAFTQALIGQMLWHPDGKTIALSVVVAPCSNPIPALLLVNVESSEIKVVESGVYFYDLEQWDEDVLVFHDGNGLTQSYDRQTETWAGE